MNKETFIRMKQFIMLWITQSFSQLSSSMISFALSIWLYETTGSALKSATLMICSYAPYVIVSIFAGALSDKWNKKRTMLIADGFAAFTTLVILILILTNRLLPWHLYLLNVFNGFMNAFQQPASETAVSILTPQDCYQKASGLNSLSRSLITIFNPILATTIYSLLGIRFVCYFDLFTFVIAFVTLLFFIKINEDKSDTENEEFFVLFKEGFRYLKNNKLILNIILFMSGINFVATAFDTVLTPLVLLKTNNNETILGIVSSFSGIALLIGSFIVSISKESDDKPRMIWMSMFISMLLENFFMAFSDSYIVWCFAQLLGWIPVPIFTANYEVLFKKSIPVSMQGRVYSFRNCLQFFTIPLGYFAGGFMVDNIFVPLMNAQSQGSILVRVFGNNPGAGASLSMFVLAVLGILVCLPYKNRLLHPDRYK